MENINQKKAVWLWQSLPHLLIWLGLFIQITLTGYNPFFSQIGLAIPLMVALIWSWEWRSHDIVFSLLIAGLCLDLLSATPLGWHGILWAGAYMLLPVIVYQFSEDEPFAVKWLTTAGALLLLIISEWLLTWVYGLSTSTLASMIFRLLIMLMLLPFVSWFAIRLKLAFYRKLWMLLPEEMRIRFRT